MPKSSTPLPRDPKYTSKAQVNRAEQIRRDNDRQKNVTVSLLDHDSAVMYYFNEVIKPVVVPFIRLILFLLVVIHDANRQEGISSGATNNQSAGHRPVDGTFHHL